MIERRMGFVGAGKMADALVSGMIASGAAAPERLFVADPAEERRQVFAAKLGANVLADNAELARACDVLVLSVKPHVVPQVCADLADAITADHLVASIAAGVTLGALEVMLHTDRLIRIMPNTPALVGTGAAAYCTGAGATEADATLVAEMLGAVGVCVRVGEEHMDAVTGLSGSGPAYVYLVIEALAAGGAAAGLPADVAGRLAAQTVLGAGRMAVETGRDPAQLRKDVTTPGGTTEQGLLALDNAGVRQAFVDAVAAATEKSRRLAEEK
jgi:pyrroline-5-carboxylate reductase